jgi:Ca-activated chloride channel family protein
MTRAGQALGAAFAIAMAGVSVAFAQNPTFSSRVDAVRVDVLVTENGTPVRGLRAADFEIFDNGVRQTVDLVSFEQLPLNVVFTFDLSDSVSGERLANLRDAGGAVLSGLRKEDQAALVAFNSRVIVGPPLTPEIARVRQALEDAEPRGATSLIDASFAGMMLAGSDAGRGLVIVFSDGRDTSSWLKADAVVDAAKRSDAVVYGIAAGLAPREAFLADLTNQTGGRLFRIESTKGLSDVFLEVLDEFRQRYLVSYSPSGVTQDGWHQLTVRVKGRTAAVRARPGYLAGQ